MSVRTPLTPLASSSPRLSQSRNCLPSKTDVKRCLKKTNFTTGSEVTLIDEEAQRLAAEAQRSFKDMKGLVRQLRQATGRTSISPAKKENDPHTGISASKNMDTRSPSCVSPRSGKEVVSPLKGSNAPALQARRVGRPKSPRGCISPGSALLSTFDLERPKSALGICASPSKGKQTTASTLPRSSCSALTLPQTSSSPLLRQFEQRLPGSPKRSAASPPKAKDLSPLQINDVQSLSFAPPRASSLPRASTLTSISSQRQMQRQARHRDALELYVPEMERQMQRPLSTSWEAYLSSDTEQVPRSAREKEAPVLLHHAERSLPLCPRDKKEFTCRTSEEEWHVNSSSQEEEFAPCHTSEAESFVTQLPDPGYPVDLPDLEASVQVVLAFQKKAKLIKARILELQVGLPQDEDVLASEADDLQSLVTSVLQQELRNWVLLKEVREQANFHQIQRCSHDLNALEKELAAERARGAVRDEKLANQLAVAGVSRNTLLQALEDSEAELQNVKLRAEREKTEYHEARKHLEAQIESIDAAAAAAEAERTEECLRARMLAQELEKKVSRVSQRHHELRGRHRALRQETGIERDDVASLDSSSSTPDTPNKAEATVKRPKTEEQDLSEWRMDGMHLPHCQHVGAWPAVSQLSQLKLQEEDPKRLGRLLHDELARVSRLLQVNGAQRAQIGRLLYENERLRDLIDNREKEGLADSLDHNKQEVVEAVAVPQCGDLVVLLSQGHRFAIVTKVHEVHCTVVLLDEARMHGCGEHWPDFQDMRVESTAFRAGAQVLIRGMRSGKNQLFNGVGGTIIAHPKEGHPCWVTKQASPEKPVLTFCVRLDQSCGQREKLILIEPRFLIPKEQMGSPERGRQTTSTRRGMLSPIPGSPEDFLENSRSGHGDVDTTDGSGSGTTILHTNSSGSNPPESDTECPASARLVCTSQLLRIDEGIRSAHHQPHNS